MPQKVKPKIIRTLQKKGLCPCLKRVFHGWQASPAVLDILSENPKKSLQKV
jgi:hypothetical protein